MIRVYGELWERDKQAEHRVFLGGRNYPVCYYNGGYTGYYACVEIHKVQNTKSER